MLNPAISRWPTTLLLVAFVLSACDSETPTPAPSPSRVNNQPTNTPGVVVPVGTTTPTVGSTVEASGPDTPTPGEALIGTPPVGTPLPTAPPPTPGPPRPPSSYDMIDMALAAGKLDPDTALVYELYAHYMPDKLPTAYRGDDSGTPPEPTALFSELHERMNSLPSAAKAEVQPFFLRPDDPQSYWYQAAAQQSSTNARGPGLALLSTPNFKYKDSARIRVWYDARKSGNAQKAIDLGSEIDRSDMWNKEKKAMLGREPCSDDGIARNGGDSRLDAYVVDQATQVLRTDSAGLPKKAELEGAQGVMIQLGPSKNCPDASFLLVDASLDSKKLRSTTAHELFHAFEYSLNWSPHILSQGYGWWVEASAEWAEDLVYPTDDIEQDSLQEVWAFRPKYDGPLDVYNRENRQQYGSYLWPFYLRQVHGGDETVVGELWQASEHETPIKVMSHIAGWDKRFKEFALWNWNYGPVDKYRDAGRHIEVLGQNREVGLLYLPSHREYTATVDLPRVSVSYYDINVTDFPSADGSRFVNQVRFDLGGLAGNAKRGIQAIVQLGDDPINPKGYIIEDWSDLGERVLCREVTPISSVTLVVSNGAIDGDNLKGQIKAEALNKQCPKEASFTFTMDGEYSLDRQQPLQEKGAASIKQALTSSWDIAFIEHLDTERSTGYQDVTRYVFTATNTYEVHMSGNYVSTTTLDAVNASLVSDGIYNTHNPPLPDEDEYKYMHQGPDNEQALAARRGVIETYKDKDGKYQSMVGFVPPPVALRYVIERHQLRNCPPNESATYDEVMNEQGDNAVAKGSPDCLTNGPTLGSHAFKKDKPDLYGAPSFVPDSKSPGNWQITPFDPTKGIIEGDLSFNVTSCQQALGVDTLSTFATLLPAYDRYGGQNAQGCSVTYHAHYRVKLPPKN